VAEAGTPHRALVLGLGLALAAVAALAGCATATAPHPRQGLAGTQWQLRSVTSMDDTQGRTVVPEPQRYTLRFDANGNASLQLDCNRGFATWKAEPAVGGLTGSLSFGPLAATRALCPAPRLDERIARDLPFVRGFRLQDGKLFLSLLADGGIYEREPAGR
jgi:heat shock protein HslJ